MTITVLDNMEYGSDALARSTYNGDSTAAWLSGWSYRKSITLSRSSGSVTNYQMTLLIGESSGATGENVDCNSHCLSSFNDLRFTKSDGTTLLDYWIESISGTTPNQLATVWIEFDSIGTTNTVFYMYYGNSGASSASNGDNTFPFFDDFSSGLDTTNKWTINAGSPSVSGGILTVGNATNDRMNSKISFGYNYSFLAKLNITESSDYSMFGFGNHTGYWEPSAVWMNYNDKYFTSIDSSHATSTSHSISFNSYRYHEITRFDGSVVYSDNGSTTTVTTNNPTGSLPVGFVVDNNGSHILVDWVFVRNKESIDPSWGTWGSEITYGTPIVYSETTNIIEGSYSLKAIAAQTTSLNKTLTRTISSPINLTGHAYIIGKIRASRTGSNIKIGFHDSGGTTTEITPNISAADTWQTIQLDISGVSDANKDAIDQIIITVVNADADNTFYLDNFFAVDATDFAAGVQVSKAVGYAVLYPIANAMNVSKVVAYAVLGPYVEPADGGPMMWIF